MSDYSMADISSLLQSMGSTSGLVAKNSTSRANNTDLDMTDFLQLMVVQLQSQTLDDSMDTSEMMNQLVQMQMITAITNMTETNIMTYASSLVGKEVTIGIIDSDGNLEERVINIIGTGYSAGQQVLFGDDGETYALNQIMAVGRLPEIPGVNAPEEGGDSDDKVDNVENQTPDVKDPAEGEGSGSTDDVENNAPIVKDPTETENEDNSSNEGEDPEVSEPEAVG